MRKLVALLLVALLTAPATTVLAADLTLEELRKQVEELLEEVDYLSSRVDKTERHVAMDRIQWYGDMRVKADTLHYKDVTFNPGINVDFDDFGQQLNAMMAGMTPEQIGAMMEEFPPGLMEQIMAGGIGALPMAEKRTYNINNDILYTTRLRLGMRASIADNVDFSGRLLMYKNWGDSTGVKVFDSWNSFTMDGTNSGNTTGDWLRVERAYFDWKDIAGSNFYLSIGRRPSTYGPPSQYRENEMRGGTPSGHLVHFNFDGVTAGYQLGRVTGIPGQVVRFCYGQGFESEWGNGELFNEVNTKDVHLGGFNIDAYNDNKNFLQFTLFRAWDVTDGFKGLIAFPNQFAKLFDLDLNNDLQQFPNFNFVTRVQPSTNIGDITLGGIGFTREEDNGLNWFASGGWTYAEPNGNAGLFGGLLSDPVYQVNINPETGEMGFAPVGVTSSDNQHGYSVYVGVQIPAWMGKLGLEYNFGSQYWTPFTQAQDDMIGSKLATRGHVGEAYYIFDLHRNMFIKLGGLYYDYKYTGSGSPVGAPQKVADVKDGRAVSMLPVVDTAWNAYASMSLRF
jgi:hypothetical protein